VSSVEASSMTIISTSLPAARALSTARGNRCGRSCVGIIRLTFGMSNQIRDRYAICLVDGIAESINYSIRHVKTSCVFQAEPTGQRVEKARHSFRIQTGRLLRG